MGMKSRTKGKVGERELADKMRAFGWPARRGQQRSGVDQADVIDGPTGWHFESKRVERLRLFPALEQARRDAPKGDVPVVATRRNHGEWYAVVPLDAFLRVLAIACPPPTAPTPPPAEKRGRGRPPKPWDCLPTCGATSNRGKTCARCGLPREIAASERQVDDEIAKLIGSL